MQRIDCETSQMQRQQSTLVFLDYASSDVVPEKELKRKYLSRLVKEQVSWYSDIVQKSDLLFMHVPSIELVFQYLLPPIQLPKIHVTLFRNIVWQEHPCFQSVRSCTAWFDILSHGSRRFQIKKAKVEYKRGSTNILLQSLYSFSLILSSGNIKQRIYFYKMMVIINWFAWIERLDLLPTTII